MATTAPPADKSPVRPADQPLRVPPVDTIWKRYSAHNEAPLSFVGSAALHLLILGLMVFYAVVLLAWFRGQPKALPIETIRMPSGGGGNLKGNGNAPGFNVVGGEDPSTQGADPAANITSLVERPPLDAQEQSAVKVEFNNDPAAQRFIADGNENMKMLARLDKEVRDKLRNGVNPGPPPSKGQGGTGKDGGQGTGEGPAKGSGQGDGRILNEREKRMLRWSMSFDTRSGMDYLNQLAALGATIAVPEGKDYKICDLSKRPFQLIDQDLSKIQKIYWVDDKPESVRSLMTALGVRGNPSHFVAFMTPELEAELAKKELQYHQLKEDQIYETTFKCIRRGVKYEVIVTGQKRK